MCSDQKCLRRVGPVRIPVLIFASLALLAGCEDRGAIRIVPEARNIGVVEQVFGFCKPEQRKLFFRQLPDFERMLNDEGIILVKLWLDVGRAEQLRRFLDREKDPLKQWKLSPIDMASLDKWEEYTVAKEAMFFHTDTADAPWTVIKSDCKKRARLNALRYVLHRLPYANKDPQRIGNLDPLIVGRAHVVYERGEKQGPAIL